MTETIEYLAERYPDLAAGELTKLRAVGMQFCKPVISRLRREDPPEEPAAGAEQEEVALEAPIKA